MMKFLFVHLFNYVNYMGIKRLDTSMELIYSEQRIFNHFPSISDSNGNLKKQ